jgi:hypothetical protein
MPLKELVARTNEARKRSHRLGAATPSKSRIRPRRGGWWKVEESVVRACRVPGRPNTAVCFGLAVSPSVVTRDLRELVRTNLDCQGAPPKAACFWPMFEPAFCDQRRCCAESTSGRRRTVASRWQTQLNASSGVGLPRAKRQVCTYCENAPGWRTLHEWRCGIIVYDNDG